MKVFGGASGLACELGLRVGLNLPITALQPGHLFLQRAKQGLRVNFCAGKIAVQCR